MDTQPLSIQVEGSVNGDKFEDFVRSSLLPILQDNASIHHVDGVVHLIENQAGALFS